MDPPQHDAVKNSTRPRFVSAPDFADGISSLDQYSIKHLHSLNETNLRLAEGNGISGKALSPDKHSPFESPTSFLLPSVPRENTYNSIFPSTTFLHIQERPSTLPQKSPSESERHRKECDQIICQVKKKQYNEYRRRLAEKDKKSRVELHTQKLLRFWRCVVIPNWKFAYRSKRVHDLWWHGLPSAIRSQVWSLVICNPLGITKDLFEACLCRSQQNIKRIAMEQRAFESRQSEQMNVHPRHLPASATPRLQANCRDQIFFPSAKMNGHAVNPAYSSSTDKSDCIQSPASHNGFQAQFLPLSALCSSMQELNDSSLRVISLDVSRTFPMLGLFQANAPYHQSLHDVLSAYVSYQPSVGYLQGMSFIAAILLLVMDDVFMAFVAFATILNRQSFHAFYTLDESEFSTYFLAFDRLLEECMPRLRAHFVNYNLDSRLFLFDWMFTIFSRSLPLEANIRIWDLYMRDGETALLLSALGIMRLYEEKLLSCDFDQLASFLTGPMPHDMCPDQLVSAMRSLCIRNRRIQEVIISARKSEHSSANHNSTLSPPSPDQSSCQISSTVSESHRRSSISFLSADLTDESLCHQFPDDEPMELKTAVIPNGISNYSSNSEDQFESRPDTESECHSNSEVPTDQINNSSSLKPLALAGNSKGHLFTRFTFLRRHDSMEDWSAQVRTDLPKREAIVDSNGGNFMFTN